MRYLGSAQGALHLLHQKWMAVSVGGRIFSMLCRPCIVEVRILQGGGSVAVCWAWSDGVATVDEIVATVMGVRDDGGQEAKIQTARARG